MVSQSGRKGATKVFKHQLSLEHFQTVKRMLVPDTKNALYYCANQWTASEFFSWVCTRRLLTQSWLVWLMHQRNANSPFQNTVYPKTKDTFPKIQAWAYNRYIHVCIDHAFVNIREFKITRQLTATKTSHEKWIHIISVSIMIIPTRLLCQMQANSSGAEFLSTISSHKEK